jgi:uncharacterized protein YecT (DUF1311 family)
MRKLFFIIVNIIIINFAVDAQADISECTEQYFIAPGSTKARICAYQELEKLETEMNNFVKAVVVQLRKCQKCGLPDTKDFLAAQKSWTEYRNINCGVFEFSETLQNLSSLYLCEARLTKARIRLLQGYLSCLKDGGASCGIWPLSASAEPCETREEKK